MKNVKIVIGANYGDEGKGLMVHHFTQKIVKEHEHPIVIFHNGTAQRGHTVDYYPKKRHVYHHFNSGTDESAPTFFAKTFLLHPMEFTREWIELRTQNIAAPICYCDPDALVITPYDMMVDRATEEWIALQNGDREFGSCAFGSWCAVEGRFPMNRTKYAIIDFLPPENIPFLMERVWEDCLSVLVLRGVDISKTSFAHLLQKDKRDILVHNFTQDVLFLIHHVRFVHFEDLWNQHNNFIFENAQGLGLDVNVANDWHTTSNTGLTNPVAMLADKTNFNAEVCYVTRSYLTRHGVGPLEEATSKESINKDMIDLTNVPNEFQGALRYGFLEDADQKARIAKDWSIIQPNDNRFTKSIAITHCNEFETDPTFGKYYSDDKFTVRERK